MITYIILGIIALIIFGAIFTLIKFRKVGKLSDERVKFYKKQIIRINTPANSYKEQIMDFDKLYHHLLKDLGYEGSFGEILKKNPKEITDINNIWKLHKLRNKLAHDFEEIDDNILRKRVNDFKKEIENLI